LTESLIHDGDKPWEEMSEKERIDFIRETAGETIQRGMKSIFGSNKYKPKKPHQWEEQLDRGKKLVRAIVGKKRRERV